MIWIILFLFAGENENERPSRQGLSPFLYLSVAV